MYFCNSVVIKFLCIIVLYIGGEMIYIVCIFRWRNEFISGFDCDGGIVFFFFFYVEGGIE